MIGLAGSAGILPASYFFTQIVLNRYPAGGMPALPGVLFSRELHMPARLSQQDDENKVGRASVTKSLVARRLASLACRASVHGVPAPPLPKFDFLRRI
jgi:hypothetical protein